MAAVSHTYAFWWVTGLLGSAELIDAVPELMALL